MVSKGETSTLMSRAQDARLRSAKSGSPRRLEVWMIFTYAVLIFGIIIAILPFFWMVSTSLMTLGAKT